MALPNINITIPDLKIDPLQIEPVKIEIEDPVKIKVCLDKKLVNLIIFIFVIILLIVIVIVVYKVFKIKYTSSMKF